MISRTVYKIYKGYNIYKSKGGYNFTNHDAIMYTLKTIKEIQQWIDDTINQEYKELMRYGFVIKKKEFECAEHEIIKIIKFDGYLYYVHVVSGEVMEITKLCEVK